MQTNPFQSLSCQEKKIYKSQHIADTIELYTFAFSDVSPHPFVAVAVIAAGSIFVGWNTIQCCVFNQCPC